MEVGEGRFDSAGKSLIYLKISVCNNLWFLYLKSVCVKKNCCVFQKRGSS